MANGSEYVCRVYVLVVIAIEHGKIGDRLVHVIIRLVNERTDSQVKRKHQVAAEYHDHMHRSHPEQSCSGLCFEGQAKESKNDKSCKAGDAQWRSKLDALPPDRLSSYLFPSGTSTPEPPSSSINRLRVIKSIISNISAVYTIPLTSIAAHPN
jgi:hypothetical protein